MTDEFITRIDHVTLTPGSRPRFQELLRSQYIPRVEEAGLLLVGIVLSPPVDAPDRETDVVLTWRLDDVDAFWRARATTMSEPSVAAFWESTASLVTRRTRRYGRSYSDAKPVGGEPERALPGGTVHQIVLLNLREGHEETAPSAQAAERSWFGRHLPGSVGNVDASWELDTDRAVTAQDLKGLGADLADTIVLGQLLGGAARAPDLRNGVKRTLLLRVRDSTPDAVVAAFEQDLLAMPRHIGAIRNWRLSRVRTSTGGWTHAWEQEYEDLAGLQHDYMRSPFHWAVVDGWFDPDDPRCIVQPRILHLFYEMPISILSPPSVSAAVVS
jgi:hypothetical protein